MKTSQRAEFECCYISDGQLNAHRYQVEVTVSGKIRYQQTGMVIEFKKFREYLMSVLPDNHFIVSITADPDVAEVALAMKSCGVPVDEVNFNISCESLCAHVATTLQSVLYVHEPGVAVQKVILKETPNSFAIWGE